MNDEIWDEVISQYASDLIRNQVGDSPTPKYLCPICGKELKIQKGRYQRGVTRMIGITIECNECERAVAKDYIERE